MADQREIRNQEKNVREGHPALGFRRGRVRAESCHSRAGAQAGVRLHGNDNCKNQANEGE